MATKPHVHNYGLVRIQTKQVNGKQVVYKFWKCRNKGCPEPDKMTVG